MPNNRSIPQLILIICFLAIIFGVPLAQAVIELCSGGRIQVTDLFRRAPSEENFRLYERAMEDESWFHHQLRPRMQSLLFKAIRELGAKALIGRSGWLFFKPGVQYLVQADRSQFAEEDSIWADPAEKKTRRESVINAIVRFRDQLRTRNINLLVVPVPGKASVYPDMLTRRLHARYQEFQSPTSKLMDQLREHGVECVDLFALFHRLRTEQPRLPEGKAYYLARDTHWTPEGAKRAAHEVARRINELAWLPARKRQYQTKQVEIKRYGDILGMLQIAGIRDAFPAEPVQSEQVFSRAFGPMIPSSAGRPGSFMNPMQLASILVLGDSYCRIYQLREPASLGDMRESDETARNGKGQTRKLIPGSAGFVSHLALALQTPIDFIISDGGASTDVRRKLSTDAEILEGKNLIVWEFTERDIRLGAKGWHDVPLPPAL